MSQNRTSIDKRFIYTGDRRRYVAFVLGGIGTGSVSLTGSVRLVDWSIRNRPAIHQFNGYSDRNRYCYGNVGLRNDRIRKPAIR
jgi:non-lysosomal glucosylceramidase